jgi:hypothetical protein
MGDFLRYLMSLILPGLTIAGLGWVFRLLARNGNAIFCLHNPKEIEVEGETGNQAVQGALMVASRACVMSGTVLLILFAVFGLIDRALRGFIS